MRMRAWQLMRRGVGIASLPALLSACAPAPPAADPLSLGPASDQGPVASPAPGLGTRHAPQFGSAPADGYAGTGGGTSSSSGALSLGAGGP